MAKKKSRKPLKSTSSGQTVKSKHSDPVISLGCELVNQLGLNDTGDTLSRWMAHYIAELIQLIDSSPSASKAQAKKHCFGAILDLWSHRGELPNGKRPFEDIEPVIRTIQSLDPDDETPRYFRLARPPRESKKETKTESWLQLANDLDDTAKALIRYCLGEAARAQNDKSQQWVKLAEAAGAEVAAPEIVIRFVLSDVNKESEPDPKSILHKELSGRLKKLKGFVDLATKVCDEWQRQLETPPQKRQGRPIERKAKRSRSATKNEVRRQIPG